MLLHLACELDPRSGHRQEPASVLVSGHRTRVSLSDKSFCLLLKERTPKTPDYKAEALYHHSKSLFKAGETVISHPTNTAPHASSSGFRGKRPAPAPVLAGQHARGSARPWAPCSPGTTLHLHRLSGHPGEKAAKGLHQVSGASSPTSLPHSP